MADRWLKEIHDRMEEFEVDAPDGLWDAIEHEIRSSQRTPVINWTRLLVRAASIIAILFGCAYFIFHTDNPYQMPQPVADNIQPGCISRQSHEQAYKHDHVHADIDIHTQLRQPAIIRPTSYKNELPSPEQASDYVTEPEAETNDTINSVVNDIDTAPAYIPESGDLKGVESFQKLQPRLSDHRLAFNMYTSGGLESSLARQNAGGSTISPAGADGSIWNDSPLLGMMLYNQGHTINTKITHHQPIRAGLSFTYNFNKRIGLESGIAYTYLHSDITEGTDKNYYLGEQALHYLGIPVNVKYLAVSWKRFDIYASAGITIEKCISAHIKDSYILNGETSGTPHKQGINDKPWQFSANISVGIQYNITRRIGLYAEPGIGYYFNDGSDLQTIYKDKPFNFVANIGLRFTFDNN